MLKKNEIYEMEISDIGSQGEGIGRVDNFTLFVEGVIPGDFIRVLVVKLKKQYGYAKLLEIIRPSADRVEPVCSVAGRCGGCHLQHLSYPKQLEYKQRKVENCIKRLGGLANVRVENIVGMESPFGYRNKAQFPVGATKVGAAIGFYAARSHRLIPVRDCVIQHPVTCEVNSVVEEFLRKYDIKPYDEENHSGLVRHVLTRVGFVTGEIMVCLVVNGDGLPNWGSLVEALRKINGMTGIVLNKNVERTNVILGGDTKILWGKGCITDYIGELKFEISPLSFFQVNPVQTEILYRKVLEFAMPMPEDIVVDAYCGIGTISLFLANHVKKVYGVESVSEAIADAKNNARLNGIDNVEFIIGQAEKILPQMMGKAGLQPDIIVVDPPRKGCEPELLEAIIKTKPSKIVYVSCDPATMARDLRLLAQTGDYAVEKVQPVDCFPMTYHVETVVLISRKDG